MAVWWDGGIGKEAAQSFAIWGTSALKDAEQTERRSPDCTQLFPIPLRICHEAQMDRNGE